MWRTTYLHKILHPQLACLHKKPRGDFLNNTVAHCSSPELMGLPLKKTPRRLSILLITLKQGCNNNIINNSISISIIDHKMLTKAIFFCSGGGGGKGVVVASQESAFHLYIYITQLEYCVVPGNIPHPSHRKSSLVWTPHSSGHSRLKPHIPSEFSITSLGLGMDLFWNCTLPLPPFKTECCLSQLQVNFLVWVINIWVSLMG